MKITQNTLERDFTISFKGKTYFVNYLNSDGHILGLLNRDNWVVLEDGEEINIYEFKSDSKKQRADICKNRKLVRKLINFCSKNFDSYKG